jgi:hypothetical protein
VPGLISFFLDPVVLFPTVAAFVLGAIVGRWWTAMAPLVGWPVYFLVGGLTGGELWYLFLAVVEASGLAAVGVGILLHKWFVGKTPTASPGAH